MNKADKYLKETLEDILQNGDIDKDPRPKYEDGEPAYSKFITQQVFQYNIEKGEFPVITLRTTPFKAAWHDIEAIYIKQINVVEEMHPSIHSWWMPWAKERNDYDAFEKILDKKLESSGFTLRAIGLINEEVDKTYHSLSNTYGHTIERYDLMNKLLKGLENNPFSRRHSINLNQEQQKIDDPTALQPCAFETLWAVREKSELTNKINERNEKVVSKEAVRYLDVSLIQRSQDTAITFGINALQYLYLAMMVVNHLTFKTGIKHKVSKLIHFVNNSHLYLRHESAAKEILSRETINGKINIELNCKPKDFYSHTFEDFTITVPKGIKKLESKLELAI